MFLKGGNMMEKSTSNPLQPNIFPKYHPLFGYFKKHVWTKILESTPKFNSILQLPNRVWKNNGNLAEEGVKHGANPKHSQRRE
jgi:hypothetical protein